MMIPGAPMILSEAAQLRPRRLARLASKRPLTLLDATGLGLAKLEAAIRSLSAMPSAGPARIPNDIFTCNAADYPHTRAWGAWFRTQLPHSDGIMWTSRQYDIGQCVVLYYDRCASDLVLCSRPTELYRKGSRSRQSVDEMIGQLGWGIGA